jgi:hypothetical protein
MPPAAAATKTSAHTNPGRNALMVGLSMVPDATEGDREEFGQDVRAGPLRLSRSPPFQLPHREAADVEMVLVQAGIGVIARELDLELQIFLSNWQVTYGTRGADPGTSPRAVGPLVRQFSGANHLAGFLSKHLLVHLVHLGEHAEGVRRALRTAGGQARCQ